MRALLFVLLLIALASDDKVQDYIDLLREQGKPEPRDEAAEDIAKELNDIEDMLIIKEFIK